MQRHVPRGRLPQRLPLHRLLNVALAGALLVGATFATSAPAFAQATTTTAPATEPAAPPAEPTPPAALEAGDTAPAPGAPVQPLTPYAPGTSAPGVTPPMAVAEPGPPPERARAKPPVYEEPWFWSVVGVVVVTVAIITLVSIGSPDPTTPKTTLGDMRAF
jgi:hypothetical protein